MRVYRRSVLRTRVRFGETDAAGIAFYPSFFAWFDAGMHELLRSGDEPGHGPDGKPKYPLPIVEAGATFLAPIQYDEPIEIVSTIAELGESSLRVEHEVRHRNGVAARGFEVRVYVDVLDGRVTKAPIPDGLRAHLSEAGEEG
jgi:acyl-CoA thioester hydrolase